MAQRCANYYAYGNYRGRKCWEVTHPRHPKPLIVRAATADQAMMAAAHVWCEDWKKVSFHSQCRVKERPDISAKLAD